MNLGNLLKDTFAQSLLLAIISAILPLSAAHLTERFGWRSSIKKDAELYTYLRDTAGEDMSESEAEVLRVLRARVFDRARSHTVEHSKGLRLLSKGFLVLLYAPFPIIVLGIILQAFGYPEALQLLSDFAQWIVAAILLMGMIMTIWSILDWLRWSKARDSLVVKSKLLSVSDHDPLHIKATRKRS